MRRWLVAGALALAAGGSVGAAEAPAPVADGAVVAELRELRLKLDELVELLRGQAETQRLGLWMQRIELAQRRLAPLEEERRRVQAEREAIGEEQDQLEARLAAFEEEVAEAERRLQASDPDVERVRSDFELRQGFLRGRLRSLDARLVAIENDITERRGELEAWEQALDRRLDAPP